MLTAGVLRRMARDLHLNLDEDAMAERGISQRARDAFWVAANRAALEAIPRQGWSRLARLYEAQSEILRAEQRPHIELLRRAFAADLEAIQTDEVSIIANCCDVCRRDDATSKTVADERILRRLPHVDCERGRCTCMYTNAPVQ